MRRAQGVVSEPRAGFFRVVRRVMGGGARTLQVRSAPFYLSVLALLLLGGFFTHLSLGPVPLKQAEVWQWLIGRGDGQTAVILGQLRLPRALLALAVGASLALCGCATQSLFRNPLADPSLIGVSAGASAGASLVIVAFAQQHWQWFGLSLVSIGAFTGGLAVVWLVFKLSTGRHGTSVVTMLLAGVTCSYLAGSLSHFLEYMADENMLKRISLWRMGGLDGADMPRATMMMAIAALVAVWLWRLRPALNVLLLGESEARHLGFNVKTLRWQIVLCVALGVGASVALAGSIAFVGLIVPHIARIWVGPDHRKLLPVSALLGALLLLLADVFARTLIAPAEIPVGLLIAVLGAPLFLLLLRQRMRYPLAP